MTRPHRLAEVLADEPSVLTEPLRVAVVGAGLAGLAAARALSDHGHAVVVFDKGRGPGGRTSTRRGDGVAFDHGAQYFTARDPRFRRAVESWRSGGLVAAWEGRLATLGAEGATPKDSDTERLVAVPGMNALAKHLAGDLEVRQGVRVAPLGARAADGWRLAGDDGGALGTFDVVVVTAPAPQAAELVEGTASLADRARAVPMTPCLAALLHLDERWALDFDGAFCDGGVLSWIARNSSKPGRPAGEAWVLHASPDWSAAHAGDDPGDVVAALRAEVERLTGVPAPAALATDAHRWSFAQSPEPVESGYLADDGARVVLAGDWCHGNRVEGAWLSGVAAAGHVLRKHR